MIKFSKNISNIEYNRRKELIERSTKIIKLIENNRTRSNYSNGLEWKLSKAKSLYWLKYNENLTIEELTLVYLYVTFPNDDDFINLLKKHDNNFIKVANVYGVSASFVKLRYTNLLFMEMNKLKDMSNHKEMNEHKRMSQHKNMDEHKPLIVKENDIPDKTLKLSIYL